MNIYVYISSPKDFLNPSPHWLMQLPIFHSTSHILYQRADRVTRGMSYWNYISHTNPKSKSRSGIPLPSPKSWLHYIPIRARGAESSRVQLIWINKVRPKPRGKARIRPMNTTHCPTVLLLQFETTTYYNFSKLKTYKHFLNWMLYLTILSYRSLKLKIFLDWSHLDTPENLEWICLYFLAEVLLLRNICSILLCYSF